MEEETLVFNGINGATGGYLLDPLTPQEIAKIALGERLDDQLKQDLETRKFQMTESHYALKSGLDPQDMAQAGWGVIFPASWDAQTLGAVREALSPLLVHRQAQAGARYKEYTGGAGYRPNETKNDFLVRHGAGPGPVDPDVVPYYLLIVGDPHTIPYRFQFELDVAYLVGRIEFKTLAEYAQYASSVLAAETDPAFRLSRRATFFGVANPSDRATELSAQYLVKPLAEKMAAAQPSWDVQHIGPDMAYKSRLQQLLGGDDTPALLFTASHGMGYPNGDPRQFAYQGALLCQDWPGMESGQHEVAHDHFLAAEDINSDAKLAGLVAFHFACFGAGTPYWDDFARQAFSTRSAIAPQAFLAALPQRLLGHPRGGALAVVGHVDRAWGYSFAWGGAGAQTVTFESSLNRLMMGETVGSALDDFNLRYAEIATMLNAEIEEAEYTKPDPVKLARLWTANNDAKGYAMLGDPAVRLPLARDGDSTQERPDVIVVPASATAITPPVASEPQPEAAPAGLDSAAEQDFLIGVDTLKGVRDSLGRALNTLAARLGAFAEDISGLDVVTYVSDSVEDVQYDPATRSYTPNARPRARTHIDLDGDTQIVIPVDAGEIDAELWEIHSQMVAQAMAHRAAMLKTAAEVLTGLLPKIG
jgi:hypothetical protein